MEPALQVGERLIDHDFTSISVDGGVFAVMGTPEDVIEDVIEQWNGDANPFVRVVACKMGIDPRMSGLGPQDTLIKVMAVQIIWIRFDAINSFHALEKESLGVR